jgi:hypothetical protein
MRLAWVTFLVLLLPPYLFSHSSALAQSVPRCSFDARYPDGAVFALEGTPHLWIFESKGGVGTVHWAGDTRALLGRSVEWGHRCSMDAGFAARVNKGDPWLSTGLVKIGDPIYLAKWETEEAVPTLLHIQSLADVQLFGIGSANYGQFVLERADWERRYGFSTNALQRGSLAAAVLIPGSTTGTAAPGSCATPSATVGAATIRPGETQTLFLSGFSPGSSVITSVTGPGGVTSSSTVTIDTACRYSGYEVVPRALPSGAYTYSAQGIGSNGQRLQLTVTFTIVGGQSLPSISTTEIGIASITSLVGARLVADDGEFIGVISSSRFSSDSICNDFGDYGSSFSSKSIKNEFGQYGSRFSPLSAYNQFATTPPTIFRGGLIVGVLSKNRFLSGAVDPDTLLVALDCPKT